MRAGTGFPGTPLDGVWDPPEAGIPGMLLWWVQGSHGGRDPPSVGAGIPQLPSRWVQGPHGGWIPRSPFALCRDPVGMGAGIPQDPPLVRAGFPGIPINGCRVLLGAGIPWILSSLHAGTPWGLGSPGSSTLGAGIPSLGAGIPWGRMQGFPGSPLAGYRDPKGAGIPRISPQWVQGSPRFPLAGCRDPQDPPRWVQGSPRAEAASASGTFWKCEGCSSPCAKPNSN